MHVQPVIDTHVHVFESTDMLPEKWVGEIYEAKRQTLGKERFEKWQASFSGGIPALLSDMNDAGVQTSVICALDHALVCGMEARRSVWDINAYVADAQRRYPDRLCGFVGIDPLRAEALPLLKRAIGDWGLRGVKIMPHGARLTDERFAAFFGTVNEMELPVLVHQGPNPPPYTAEFLHPMDLDALSLRYPRIRFIAAHFAKGFEDAMSAILSCRPRIAADISAWQTEYLSNRWYFLLCLRRWLDRTPQSLLFGTDWPFFSEDMSMAEWVQNIRTLTMPQPVLELGLGVRPFSDEEKDAILGGNAARILGL